MHVFRDGPGVLDVLDRAVEVAHRVIAHPDVVKDESHVPGVVITHGLACLLVKLERPLRLSLRAVNFADAVQRWDNSRGTLDFLGEAKGAVITLECPGEIRLRHMAEPFRFVGADEAMLVPWVCLVIGERLSHFDERARDIAFFAKQVGVLHLRAGRVLTGARRLGEAEHQIVEGLSARIVAIYRELIRPPQQLPAEWFAGKRQSCGADDFVLLRGRLRGFEVLQEFLRQLRRRLHREPRHDWENRQRERKRQRAEACYSSDTPAHPGRDSNTPPGGLLSKIGRIKNKRV